MADGTQRNDATQELIAMTKLLSLTISHKQGKFSSADVVTLMTGWIMVSIDMRGSGIVKVLRATMLKRGKVENADARFSRPQEFYADLNIYKGKIANTDDADKEYLQANQSALNFLYDFRSKLKQGSNEEKAFELQLTAKLNDIQKNL